MFETQNSDFFTSSASIPKLSVAICYEFFIIRNLIFFDYQMICFY